MRNQAEFRSRIAFGQAFDDRRHFTGERRLAFETGKTDLAHVAGEIDGNPPDILFRRQQYRGRRFRGRDEETVIGKRMHALGISRADMLSQVFQRAIVAHADKVLVGRHQLVEKGREAFT